MKTRLEVAAYINGERSDHYRELPNNVCSEKEAHHWGKCEIRSLLDFIYGGPPAPGEEAWAPLQLRNRPGKME